ncbi:hypothetical protein ABT340_15610 [Streptosporangium sp. NPDC000239]|uniref:hypothetical protein n=1 Tax=Streptosporangium sp. NPDC000239 TaxID=3154248 RepID=UPI0033331E07
MTVITEEPTGHKAIVLDAHSDAWQARGDGIWHCAIDGDDFSYWTWVQLLRELGPITLISAGDAGDKDVSA